MAGNQQGPIATCALPETVDYVVNKLAMCWRKSAIKRAIEDDLGITMHPRTFENILARARVVIRERAGITKQDSVAESVAFYEEILADPNVNVRDKIVARTRLDFVKGVDAHFTAGANASAEDQAAKARDALREIMAAEAEDDSEEPPALKSA